MFFYVKSSHTISGDKMIQILRKIIYLLLTLLLIQWVYRYFHIGETIVWLFNISMPLILAFIFRFIFDPLLSRFTKRHRKIACILLYGAIMTVSVGILYLAIPLVIDQCLYFYSHYDITNLKSYVHPFFKPMYDFLISLNIMEVLLDMVSGFTQSFMYWLTNILLAFGISFYLVYDDVHIIPWIEKRNFKYYQPVASFLGQAKHVTYAFIKATFLDFLFFYIASFATFSWIGLEYVCAIALFLAATNLIAYIGPYIGGIPIIIYGFFISSDIGYLCLLAIIVLQLIESNFVQPMLFKTCIQTGPISLLIALSVFGDFFGIIGMIIAPLLLAYINIIKSIISVEKTK